MKSQPHERLPLAFDVPVSVLSIEKIQQEVGWQPTTSLGEGIRKTWEWIQQL